MRRCMSPLLGPKRTSAGALQMSAFDPKRTWMTPSRAVVFASTMANLERREWNEAARFYQVDWKHNGRMAASGAGAARRACPQRRNPDGPRRKRPGDLAFSGVMSNSLWISSTSPTQVILILLRRAPVRGSKLALGFYRRSVLFLDLEAFGLALSATVLSLGP